jgi:aminopeptidase N
VQADFIDGMEYDGLYFISKDFYNWYRGTESELLVAIAAHETCHQWWYGLVGNDPALEPWLDEALCTYCERLYYELVEPGGLDWWRTYRVDYFEPQGKIDLTVYDVQGEAESYRAYRDVVYLNGALFLEELRQLTGEQAFFAFLADYRQRYTYQLASGAGFFETLRQHTPVDLTPLIEKYFRAAY